MTTLSKAVPSKVLHLVSLVEVVNACSSNKVEAVVEISSSSKAVSSSQEEAASHSRVHPAFLYLHGLASHRQGVSSGWD